VPGNIVAVVVGDAAFVVVELASWPWTRTSWRDKRNATNTSNRVVEKSEKAIVQILYVLFLSEELEVEEEEGKKRGMGIRNGKRQVEGFEDSRLSWALSLSMLEGEGGIILGLKGVIVSPFG
jgi:hypothetical protein